jgi:hypothetical protein
MSSIKHKFSWNSAHWHAYFSYARKRVSAPLPYIFTYLDEIRRRWSSFYDVDRYSSFVKIVAVKAVFHLTASVKLCLLVHRANLRQIPCTVFSCSPFTACTIPFLEEVTDGTDSQPTVLHCHTFSSGQTDKHHRVCCCDFRTKTLSYFMHDTVDIICCLTHI